MEAVERGLHVLIAKPIVKTLEEHLTLAEAARRSGVLVAMEVHKRWDPIYADARDRIRQLGDFSFFSSFMSQPKYQLQTFRSWAGQVERYQLLSQRPSHRFQRVERVAHRPAVVGHGPGLDAALQRPRASMPRIRSRSARNGKTSKTGSLASAFYTASWIAPKSDVHSQQRFYYLGQKGEVQIDQAHRGYSLATDAGGFSSPNPLFMKYTPDAQGYFSGQSGYGYRSIEAFVDAVQQIRTGLATPADFRGGLATVDDTVLVTAILEAGRRSLDSGGLPHQIEYADSGNAVALSVA